MAPHFSLRVFEICSVLERRISAVDADVSMAFVQLSDSEDDDVKPGEEKVPVNIKCIVFKSTFEQVMKNLSHRKEQTGKSIPEHIVEQQFTSFEMPTLEEGFDEIIEVNHE